jgi:hypothetical protein
MSAILPEDITQAVEQAQAAAQAAIESGLRRIQVEIQIPELKIQPVAEQFIQAFAHHGSHLRLYFPDAGAAALARRDWGDVPFTIRGIQDLSAEIQPEDELLIFVEPSAVEVLDVEKLCQQAGDRPVILLNPCLEDVAIVGIGYMARQLRDRFLSNIESVYFVKPLENAAIFRTFPGVWQVWAQSEDGTYTQAAEFPTKPTMEMLEQTFEPTVADPTVADETKSSSLPARPLQKTSVLGGLQRFLRALSQ